MLEMPRNDILNLAFLYYNNSGLLSFRHTEMFDTRKESLQTRSEALVFLIISSVYQNISESLKLNRPRLRSLSIVYRTWLSTA